MVDHWGIKYLGGMRPVPAQSEVMIVALKYLVQGDEGSEGGVHRKCCNLGVLREITEVLDIWQGTSWGT